MLITSKSTFACLARMHGFHARAKNERLTAAGLHCRQNFKYEHFTLLFGRLRQNIAAESVPHVGRYVMYGDIYCTECIAL